MQPYGKEVDIYFCRDGSFTEDPSSCSDIVEVLDSKRRISLSKLLSGILRHYPWRVGVELDDKGWAPLDTLLDGIRRLKGYEWVSERHVRAIVALDPKGRFEIKDSKIRARYGHTVHVRVEPISGDVPEVLYHGSPAENLSSILRHGIKRMRRLKVHLTETFNEALEVGARRSDEVVVFKVSVRCLREKGFVVEKASKVVYIVDYVPPECIIGYEVVEIKQ